MCRFAAANLSFARHHDLQRAKRRATRSTYCFQFVVESRKVDSRATACLKVQQECNLRSTGCCFPQPASKQRGQQHCQNPTGTHTARSDASGWKQNHIQIVLGMHAAPAHLPKAVSSQHISPGMDVPCLTTPSKPSKTPICRGHPPDTGRPDCL